MSYIIDFLKVVVLFIVKIVSVSMEQKDKIIVKYIQRKAKRNAEKSIPKNFRKK